MTLFLNSIPGRAWRAAALIPGLWVGGAALEPLSFPTTPSSSVPMLRPHEALQGCSWVVRVLSILLYPQLLLYPTGLDCLCC